MTMYVFDIEANDLLHGLNRFHIITLYNLRKKELKSYFESFPGCSYEAAGTIGQAIQLIKEADLIIGHNIAGYDIPAIKKLFGMSVNFPILLSEKTLDSPAILDTLTMSQLLFPNRKHHGLGSWGKELGQKKPEQEQWHTLDNSMIYRNREDVLINVKLYNKLNQQLSKVYKFTGLKNFYPVMKAEVEFAQVHAEQIQHGFRFNVVQAMNHVNTLDNYIAPTATSIVDAAPKHCVPTHKNTPVRNVFLKAGGYSAMVTKHYGSENEAKKANVLGPFSRIKFIELEIGSSAQLKTYMLSLGWRPTEWNYNDKWEKTSPKLTEDSYDSLPGELGKTVSNYNIAVHRRTLLLNRTGKKKGLLWATRDDGRVEGGAHTCGTPTCRARHMGIVNLPAVRSKFGKEIRKCFVAPDDSWLIGNDLSGIEIRMMCHHCMPYPGGEEFANLVMHGDFHQRNAEIWGVLRDDAKTALYALLYGCTDKSLAKYLNKPSGEGSALMAAFWGAYPAMEALVNALKEEYKKYGAIKGLDGRVFQIRAEKKLLNSLLQGNSAILFKKWAVNVFRWKYDQGIDTVLHQVLHYHDELVHEFNGKEEAAENVSSHICSLATDTGVEFNIRVKIEADGKVGKNYAEVH